MNKERRIHWSRFCVACPAELKVACLSQCQTRLLAVCRQPEHWQRCFEPLTPLPDENIVFLLVENLTPEQVFLFSNKSLKTFIVSLTITSLKVMSRRKKKSSRHQALCVLSDVKFSRPKMRRNAELFAHSDKVPAGRPGLSSRQGNVYSVCVPPDHLSGG